MSNFDQKNQKVSNQVNAENISVNINADSHSAQFACPLCLKNDMVQKVSALVNGEQTSKLTGYLSLPQKPVMPSNPQMAVVFLILIIPFCGLCTYPTVLFMNNNSNLPSFISLPIVVLSLLFPVFTSEFITRKIKDSKLPKQKQQHELDCQVWEHAKSRWGESYYCRRHDAVFIPGNNDTVTPEKFRDFLYK